MADDGPRRADGTRCSDWRYLFSSWWASISQTWAKNFRFAWPYLQDNLYLMMGMSGIFGVLRLVGAVALLRDKLWGLERSRS